MFVSLPPIIRRRKCEVVIAALLCVPFADPTNAATATLLIASGDGCGPDGGTRDLPGGELAFAIS